MKPLQHGDPISFDFSTYCGEYVYYVRDCRSYTRKAHSRCGFRSDFSSPVCRLDCPNSEANATYPFNLNAIWQVEVPEGFGVIVVIYRLEIEQAENGICKNDYITVYGDSDPKSPTKLCGKLNSHQFAFTDGTTREVTVKFQSNHENNEGLFKGGIYVLHLDCKLTCRWKTNNLAHFATCILRYVYTYILCAYIFIHIFLIWYIGVHCCVR